MFALLKEMPDFTASWMRYTLAMMRSSNREINEFNDNLFIAAHIAMTAARDNPLSMLETFEIMEHNVGMMRKGMAGAQGKMADYAFDQMEEATRAFLNTVLNSEGEKLGGYMRREAEIMEAVANFHEQIEAIGDEFGFHFNTSAYKLVHETDAFELYQVLPLKEGVKVNEHLKPVILVPPYMLGVHILAFLPYENKSYAHSFANEGIPTYVRVVKDIMTNEKVQTMTPEEDCEQTRQLCAKVMELNDGKKVTLNGTCQGGYISLMNILSGKLKDVCDALITNVTPVDGTYSEAISGMPTMHHDFITTTLPSGNKVANGYLLSLGMRFVAIDQFTLIHSIWFIAMIIVGGMGSVTGALIGVFVIRLSQELITSIGPSLIERYPFFSGEIVFAAMNIFLGGMIAGFLILEPRGLMHRWNTLKRAYRLWPYPY